MSEPSTVGLNVSSEATAMGNTIEAGLGLSAIYTGAMWLWMAVQSWRYREGYKADPELRREVQGYTFHLGLCFILSAGFLGLLLQ